MDILIEALEQAKILDDKKEIFGILMSIGNIYVIEGNYDKAIESYKHSLEIGPEISNKSQDMGLYLGNIANTYKNIGDFDKAIKIKPDSDYLFGQLFHTKNSVCNWNFFKEDLEKLTNKILKVQKI